MATLKPATPLLASNKGPLKPASPLRPKTAAKTPISHPQRRLRFQSHTDTSEQRRLRFQTTGPPDRQSLAGRRADAPSHTPARQAPLVWRAPEGQEGLAAVPVGGGGAWPGFETTRRAKLAARTARGRAAAHGHTSSPAHTPRNPAAHSKGPEAPQRLGPLACVSCSQVELNVAAGDGLDQLARVVLDRVVEQLVRRVGLDELALLHDDDVVGDLADDRQVVRDEQV